MRLSCLHALTVEDINILRSGALSEEEEGQEEKKEPKSAGHTEGEKAGPSARDTALDKKLDSLGMTNKKAAEKMGVHPSTMSRWSRKKEEGPGGEPRERRPGLDKLKQMQKELGGNPLNYFD